jgi:hypothetical protein
MSDTDDDRSQRGGITRYVVPGSAYDYAPSSISTVLTTAFFHNVRFRAAKRMLDLRTAAINAHTGMLNAEAANTNARFALTQAWERLEKDLEPTLANDRLVAEFQRAEDLMKAALAMLQAQDALEQHTAKKTRAAAAAAAAAAGAGGKKSKDYAERFKKRFSQRAEIYAARDDVTREILAEAQSRGRDESDPDVAAQIMEAYQYAEELISSLSDEE